MHSQRIYHVASNTPDTHPCAISETTMTSSQEQLAGEFVDRLKQTQNIIEKMTIVINSSTWDEKSPPFQKNRIKCRQLISELAKDYEPIEEKSPYMVMTMKQLNALDMKCADPTIPMFKTWLQILETLDVLDRKIRGLQDLRWGDEID